MSKHDLKVGQQLWFVPRGARGKESAKFVTVTKLGRDWAYVSGHYSASRISLTTLEMDGGRNYSTQGRCYLKREEYENKAAAESALLQIRNGLGAFGRPDIHLSDILQAAKLLKIEVKI